ncbi:MULTISPECIES: glycerophosphodiester phosphodiesterase [unclassified Streptomyces]|uniref:glycerophosphodiester phosphodiesterase n=1 Tax=unclassified Streptomyces TaxID=2593676 RepID=UPI0004C2AC1D|nr:MULTISPECIES: glycerophosphodiester phosphodiesterase family protein [unclassified Streptomyces]
MHARVAAATTTALLGTSIAILPPSHAGATVHDAPVIVAHRGASGYAPENTLPAVDKAAAMGFDWVENDVQRTKDGRLVVLHDDTLARTTDVEQVYPDRAPWKVGDFTKREIARLDAGSWFGPEYAGTRVPTLRQYLDRATLRHEKLVLEIKNPELYPGLARQTLNTLADRGWLDADHVRRRLVVQSFDADTVRTVHELRPAVRTAYLGTPRVADLPRYAEFTDGVNGAHPTLSAGYVSAAHAVEGPHGRPLRVMAWTVNTADVARRVAGYDVDGIITNVPDVVRRAVEED